MQTVKRQIENFFDTLISVDKLAQEFIIKWGNPVDT
jgi:hypothetical protein